MKLSFMISAILAATSVPAPQALAADEASKEVAEQTETAAATGKEASLKRLIETLCEALVKDDRKSWEALVDSPDLQTPYGNMTWGQTAFERMKQVHAREDYLKLFAWQAQAQKEAIAKGTFVLGGHDHGHLHVEMRERDGTWRVVEFRFCR